MQEVMIAIVGGVIVGALNILNFRAKKALDYVSKLALFIMLWCLAAKIGCDQQILQELGRLGVQSVGMAFGVMAGSFAVMVLLTKLLQGAIAKLFQEVQPHD